MMEIDTKPRINPKLERAIKNKCFDGLFLNEKTIAIRLEDIHFIKLLTQCFELVLTTPWFSNENYHRINISNQYNLYISESGKTTKLHNLVTNDLTDFSFPDSALLFNFIMFFRVIECLKDSEKIYNDLKLVGINEPAKLLNYLDKKGNVWVKNFLLSYE